jgi:hypothetical protein
MGMYLISRHSGGHPQVSARAQAKKRAIRIHQLLVNLVAGAMFAPPGQGGVGPSVRIIRVSPQGQMAPGSSTLFLSEFSSHANGPRDNSAESLHSIGVILTQVEERKKVSDSSFVQSLYYKSHIESS